MVRKAVVPAAGRGTRLYPATRSQPKEMLLLGRKPTIQFVMEELVGAGLESVLLVTGRDKRAIEDHFDRASDVPFGSVPLDEGHWEVFHTRQSDPKGLGDAVRLAEGFAGDEPFVVALGDAVIESPRDEGPLVRLMRVHRDCQAHATLLLRTVEASSVSHYGIVAPGDDTGESIAIADIVEKPAPADAPSRLAVSARYCFEPVLFEYIRKTPPGVGGEIQLTDAIRMMIRDGLTVRGVCLQEGEHRHDVGNFPDYLRAFLSIGLRDPELGPVLRRELSALLGPS